MPIKFRLFNDSAQTITEQIRQQVELAIAKGELLPGEPIPSVRQLAVELKVNPNTVAKSLQLLVQSGSLNSQRGRGYFVAEQTNRYSEEEKQRQLRVAAEQFVADTRPLALKNDVLIRAISELLGDE